MATISLTIHGNIPQSIQVLLGEIQEDLEREGVGYTYDYMPDTAEDDSGQPTFPGADISAYFERLAKTVRAMTTEDDFSKAVRQVSEWCSKPRNSEFESAIERLADLIGVKITEVFDEKVMSEANRAYWQDPFLNEVYEKTLQAFLDAHEKSTTVTINMSNDVETVLDKIGDSLVKGFPRLDT